MATKTQPFFMRFVEKQDNLNTGVKAGTDDKKTDKRKDTLVEQTLKYPSDMDEEYTIGWP